MFKELLNDFETLASEISPEELEVLAHNTIQELGAILKEAMEGTDLEKDASDEDHIYTFVANYAPLLAGLGREEFSTTRGE